MPDFGSDVSVFPDLDPNFSPLTGQRAVAECVARMLETPRGGLVYAPNRGFDIRAVLNESMTEARLSQVKRAVESEALKDERVLDAKASLTFVFATQVLTVKLDLTTADGPFRLVLEVTAVSLNILDGGT